MLPPPKDMKRHIFLNINYLYIPTASQFQDNNIFYSNLTGECEIGYSLVIFRTNLRRILICREENIEIDVTHVQSHFCQFSSARLLRNPALTTIDCRLFKYLR